MTSLNRAAPLVSVVVLAVGCGTVTRLPADASSGTGGAGGGGSGGAGSGGSAGTGGEGGNAGASGSGGSAGTGGAGGGGGGCSVACMVGRTCCAAACVNMNNDPMNCGACGTRCQGQKNLCSGGACVPPPCSPTTELCAPDSFCCGAACCLPGQLCCESNGQLAGGPPTCFTPTADQKTCAQGCAPLCVSDRDQKKNIAPIDSAEILDRVGRLPIWSWTYRDEPAEVRHLGPMAQDFRASFGLGDDDRTYYAVDAQGVALAAVQALKAEVAAQQARIEKLERENRDLARRIARPRAGRERTR